MQYLRLVLHNTNNQPLFFDVQIDDAIAKAIKLCGKVTKVDFLLYTDIDQKTFNFSKAPMQNLNNFKEL